MKIPPRIEKEILLSAIDEDDISNAVSNISISMNEDSRVIVSFMMGLSASNMISFYRYDESGNPVDFMIDDRFSNIIENDGHLVFLCGTEQTLPRINVLNFEGGAPGLA